MQFPLLMAEEGVQAVVDFAESGEKPDTGGEEFINTGVTLITDKPASGVDSEDTTWGSTTAGADALAASSHWAGRPIPGRPAARQCRSFS